MRRRVVRGLLVVVAIEVVLGLVPFTTPVVDDSPLRARCRGVLLESWPETESGAGWFNYAPNADVVLVSGRAQAAMCGDAARERLVPPLFITIAVGALVLGMAAVRKRTAGMPRTEG